MIPKTVSEQALFSTVQIKTDTGSGTGFFFDLALSQQMVDFDEK